MANSITNLSRFLLFGTKLDAKISLETIAKRKAANAARGLIGMSPQKGPGVRDWLWQVVKDGAQELWHDMSGGGNGQGPSLPDDLPFKLYNAIDETLRNRGGMADKELKLPNFWVNVQGAVSTPFFWSFTVDYAPSADPAKVSGFEMALEDAITRAGCNYNVRIQYRPLRIEVDKPTPPTVTLTELWQRVAAMPANSRWAMLGLCYVGGRTVTLEMTLVGEDFSMFLAGSPGSGKTQLSESIILSLAMSNSPESLAMVIIDPKAIDFRPFNALPHLALPVVNEPTQAVEVIQFLCDEMDSRTRRAARGDTAFLAHSICLYIDEMSDLFASLPDDQAAILETNIQRLGQKGRGVGFVIIGATQRVPDVPPKAQSKFNVRVVGKMRTANDSVQASGIAGTTTNKLPGRGSFEVYSSDQQGCRIQAPFVAASDKPGYERALQPFFAAINARWQGKRPTWAPPTPSGNRRTQAEPSPLPTEGRKQKHAGFTVRYSNPEADAVPVEDRNDFRANGKFKIAMLDTFWKYRKEGKEFSKNVGRVLHKQIIGKTADGDRGNEIYDWFFNECATEIAMLYELENRLEN